MTTKLLLTVAFGLTTCPVFAQYQKSPLELQTEKLIADLRRQQVDTICTYKAYCVGCRGGQVAEDSPCATKGTLIPAYLFWKKAGRTYRQYLDNCKTQVPQEIEVDFWGYASKFKTEFQSEKIKSFHVMEEGKPKRVSLNHGGYASFRLFLNQDTISQHIDRFSLTKSGEYGHNIYYRQNRRTHTYKLRRMLSKAAAQKPMAATLPKG